MFPSDTLYLDNVKKGEREMFPSLPQGEEPCDARNRIPLLFMSLFLQKCNGKSGLLPEHNQSPISNNTVLTSAMLLPVYPRLTRLMTISFLLDIKMGL